MKFICSVIQKPCVCKKGPCIYDRRHARWVKRKYRKRDYVKWEKLKKQLDL